MEILKDDNYSRIVALDRIVIGEMVELYARFNAEKAQFIRLVEYGKNRHFDLSSAQADAFCEAWLAYRADQKAKSEKEAARNAELIAKAYHIAQECPAIKIQDDRTNNGTLMWSVSVPELGFWWADDWFDSPEILLKRVKDARDIWEHARLAE